MTPPPPWAAAQTMAGTATAATATTATAAAAVPATTPASTAGPPTTGGSGAALADALAGEHAAVFAYGPIGVRLDDEEADLAREAEARHRDLRDLLVSLLIDREVAPPAAEPAYTLPFPVTDATDARSLAILVEERTAALWRAALPATAGDDRRLALDALVESARYATRWRQLAGLPPTVPFPGRPG